MAERYNSIRRQVSKNCLLHEGMQVLRHLKLCPHISFFAVRLMASLLKKGYSLTKRWNTPRFREIHARERAFVKKPPIPVCRSHEEPSPQAKQLHVKLIGHVRDRGAGKQTRREECIPYLHNPPIASTSVDSACLWRPDVDAMASNHQPTFRHWWQAYRFNWELIFRADDICDLSPKVIFDLWSCSEFRFFFFSLLWLFTSHGKSYACMKP